MGMMLAWRIRGELRWYVYADGAYLAAGYGGEEENGRGQRAEENLCGGQEVVPDAACAVQRRSLQ